MESPAPEHDHAATRRLVARYLDPRKRWDRAAEAAIRAGVGDCAACRDHYGRQVRAHRAITTGDAELPSGFEQTRLLDALLEPSVGTSSRVARHRWALASGAMATVAAVVVVAVALPGGRGTGMDDGGLVARDGGAPSSRVGLDVTGVTAAGREYEVVASGVARQADFLRFAWSNDRPELKHLFIFGLQAGREPIWYAPIPDERESLPIGTGRLVPLGFESSLASEHAPGPLRIVAIFTPEPLTLAKVAEVLETDDVPRRAALALEAATTGPERALRRALGLGASAEVHIIDTLIRPGSREEVQSDEP